jgi:hypothetical protein
MNELTKDSTPQEFFGWLVSVFESLFVPGQFNTISNEEARCADSFVRFVDSKLVLHNRCKMSIDHDSSDTMLSYLSVRGMPVG